MSFKLSIGKTAITAEDMYSNEAIMAFHDKHVVDILPEYLFYMFKFKNWDEGSNKAVMGKTLNKATLSDVEIDVCSIEKQREIVDILNKIMNILENRDNEIVLLDNLIKARFVEMFGNARENPKGYKMVLFNDIVEYMGDIGSNGANKVIVNHLDMKDEEDYAMMVRFTNFTKNDFEDDVKFVSKEAYDFFKKSQIFGGELIICKIGSAGQNYVMPYLDRPVSLGLNQIMVRIKDIILMQMSEKVRELPRDNFAVRQHLKYVDLYSSEENYNALTYEDTLIVKEEVAPLILSDGDEASAVRFDALMYGIELAYLHPCEF